MDVEDHRQILPLVHSTVVMLHSGGMSKDVNHMANHRHFDGTPSSADSYSETAEREYIFSLQDLLGIVRRWLWVIALSTVICVSGAVGYSIYQTPQYEGTILMLVGQEETDGDTSSLSSDVQGLEQLSQTVAEAAHTRPVAQGVIEELDLQVDSDEFLANLSAEQVPDTQFVEVSYQDSSPEDARDIANATGEVLSERVTEVGPSASAVTATVWEQAATPEEPASPDLVMNTLAGLILGLMLGFGLAFLLEYLDDTWRSPEEAERVVGVPTFGVVPEFKSPKTKKKGKS